MNGLGYFLRLAINNLRRGGQRIWVALLCIIFGVMSLVAMTMLSQSIESAMVIQPRQLFGADISLGPRDQDTISPELMENLKRLQKDGKVDRITTVAYNSSVMFHLPGSGEMHFASVGMGVDPAEYPLAGNLTIGSPEKSVLKDLLQNTGDVIVTRDVAEAAALNVGDRIVLSDLANGVPVEGRIRGIAYDTPNHQGSKLYYTQATAAKLNGGRLAVNTALLTAVDPAAIRSDLENAGWDVITAAQIASTEEMAQNLITFGLRGAGVLGLLVGGIGIANTMQVLLRRRQREVAIWKTMGYREGQLQLIFALEAAVLGGAGSLIGGGLGVLVSTKLVGLFRATSTMLFGWSFAPLPLVVGIVVGTLTTVIFALWAIVVSSQAQPMALLRNEPVDTRRLSWPKMIGLVILLAVPFTILTSLAMGSVLKGIELLLLALAGLVVLGGFFAFLVWGGTRLIPLGIFPQMRMAKDSLSRRGLTLVFAMIALFLGVVAMSLGVVATEGAGREMDQRKIEFPSYNLNVIAAADQEPAVRQAVQSQSPEKTAMGYRAMVKEIRALGQNEPLQGENTLIGRSDPYEYIIAGAPWGSRPGGVYTASFWSIPAGSQVQVTLTDGSTRALPVVGTYDIDWDASRLYPTTGLLMPAETFLQTIEPETIFYAVEVPDNRVTSATSGLGAALPGATVINLVAYASRYVETYHNLFVLALAMSGLALLAGILLVANSVSLAMLDRRYEIGVLKTVGYSRRHLLSTLAVEYGLVGLLAVAVGLVSVKVFLWVVGLSNQIAASVLVLTPSATAIILLLGMGLVLATVVLVSAEPIRVSPSVVLNERE